MSRRSRITLIIGGLSWMVMPTLAIETTHSPVLLRWTILVSALLGTGTVGTAITSAIGHYGFGAHRFPSALTLFGQMLPVALPITVVVGVITTVIAVSKGRLEASQLALQTQRLERERAEKLAAEAQLIFHLGDAGPGGLPFRLELSLACVEAHFFGAQAFELLGKLLALRRQGGGLLADGGFLLPQ